ncbi:single-stranded DNA-binding protein [Agromyces mediolanus]|uniref:single-stranded DNA-binding protein n=1 Tax=Agromyces mediolanus TaxID=41986 RepID=UPI0020402C54|nr:single-stranded DNA-binding protein [Agromyces mediolanus]MCM3656028.1 single-stranded DNA-binding protein [Agromyces mediolanus]
MSIQTQQSLTGFIATEPQLTTTSKEQARFYARVGVRHQRVEPDGTTTDLEPTFHHLVLFRAAAKRAHAQFAKDDSFVASGRVHAFTYERDGKTIPDEEFIATAIGHDSLRTRYGVDRSRRAGQAVEVDAAERPTPRPRRKPAPIGDAPQRPSAESTAVAL